MRVLVEHLLQAWHAETGQSFAALLEAATLDLALLQSPEIYWPLTTVERLVNAAVTVTPGLMCLKLATYADPAGFGVLGYLRQACGTLEDVIQMTLRYERLVGDLGHSELAYTPGCVQWNWICHYPETLLCQQASEYLMGVWLKICRRLSPCPEMTVHFRHSLTPPHLVSDYEKILQCPVAFGQKNTGLILPVSAMRHPLTHPDPALQETLEQHAQGLLQQLHQRTGTPDYIRERLHQLMHHGHASREALAESLGVSVRHLHRQLAEHRLNYRQIYSVLRLEVAQATLKKTSSNIGTIARQLNFSESQSFIRWFRAQTGQTPLQYRTEQSESVLPQRTTENH